MGYPVINETGLRSFGVAMATSIAHYLTHTTQGTALGDFSPQEVLEAGAASEAGLLVFGVSYLAAYVALRTKM